jgi:hypothetical protein
MNKKIIGIFLVVLFIITGSFSIIKGDNTYNQENIIIKINDEFTFNRLLNLKEINFFEIFSVINYNKWSDVKFRGIIQSDEKISLGICRGNYYFDVSIDVIISDPNNLLTYGSTQRVCFQKFFISYYAVFGTGLNVEVYGRYYDESYPIQYHDCVVVINEPYYIKNLDNHQPGRPSKPIGPTEVWPNIRREYTTSTIDPDGDSVIYVIDINNDDIIDKWGQIYGPSGETYTANIRFLNPGIVYLRFSAFDIWNVQSEWSEVLEITVKGENNPPNTPDIPLGPSEGIVGREYNFSTKTVDIDGDQVYYKWDWGDGDISEWLGPYSSGEACKISHTWNEEGCFFIKVQSKDIFDEMSGYSNSKKINITVNKPPNKPVIKGESIGKSGIEYDYTFSTIDPDGDNVYYWIIWFEGCPVVFWDGPYSSGEEIIKSYSWENQGKFTIMVKAKDLYGAESDWDSFEVSMPKNRSLKFSQNYLFGCLKNFLFYKHISPCDIMNNKI